MLQINHEFSHYRGDKMKKIIITTVFILFFAQVLFANAYPPSEEILVKEFGLAYYELRNQLPYDDAGSFFIDEALVNKEKNLNILLRLLNDKTVMTMSENSLFEQLNIKASKVVFDENRFIINAIIDLLIVSSGYEGYDQAISDDYRKFNELGKSIVKKRMQYYSLLYQKEDKMPKKCADKFSEYVLSSNVSATKYEALLDEGCMNIGILSHYADALIEEGKRNHTTREANKKVLELYKKYFDGLSDYELNEPTTLAFLQVIYFMKDIDTKVLVNKKITDLISSKKLVLTDKPAWTQKSYLTLLGQTMNFKEKERKEIIDNLKKVTKKKSNIFGFCNKEGILQSFDGEQLSNEEKNFLRLIGERIPTCPEEDKEKINKKVHKSK